MIIFVTILAWCFLILAVIRIAGILIGDDSQKPLIALAEASGQNPVGEALVKPFILLIVCAAWILSRFLS